MKRINATHLILLLLTHSALASHTIEESLKNIQTRAVKSDELIVKIRDSYDVQEANKLMNGLVQKLKAKEIFVVATPYFRRTGSEYKRERLLTEQKRGEAMPHLENYFLLRNQSCLPLEESSVLLKEVFEYPGVDFAYFEPETVNASFEGRDNTVQQETNAETPNWEKDQFHLKMAPDGVDAELAWKYAGGAGEGVKLIDVEWGWNPNHEDYLPPFWKSPKATQDSDHGTAVWGIVAGTKDNKGVTGIANQAKYGIAYFDNASVYDLAASQLSPGDILIIEQQKSGPDNNNYSAVEYWQATFDAFKTITSKGIHVIEAAGNGNSNFDKSVYNKKFDLSVRDSGAVIVGAVGAPNSETPHERMSFSNYGSRVDVHGYGNNMVTTGYGALFNGGQNRKYTAKFCGTSSATPVVAGSAASLLGMLKAVARKTTPSELREALRKTGTPQAGDTSKHVGNLPDLKQLRKYYNLD